MNSMIDRQALLDQEIASALIEATPETWKAAEMIVEREDHGGREKMAITISSPDNHKELVGATEEIYSGLYKLSDLFREHQKAWSKATYSVTQRDDGNWKYAVRFEY